MASLSIQINGVKTVQESLGKRFNPFMREAVHQVGLDLRNRATENIRNRIYRQPASPNYQRTGRALGGGFVYPQGNSTRVVHSSQLKGAKRDYAPTLNRNRRIKRFNSRFWDDAVKATNEKRNIDKVTSPTLKKFLRSK